MADQGIHTKYHTAFAILFHNVRRVLANHAGDDTRIGRQIAELDSFFRAVAENRHCVTEDDWEYLCEYHSEVRRGLCQARSQPPPPPAAADELTVEGEPQEMHRGLRIPEIVRLIVFHISPTTDRTTLAALARTSQIFHDHALDVLWEQQTKAANLIRCFPGDLVESQKNRFRIVLNFRRPFATADWGRVLHYSNRIRSFEFPPLYFEDASKVYEALSHTEIPGKHLLPNLRSLSTGNPYDSRPIPPEHVALFLGPQLSYIRMGTAHASLFPVLTERFSALQSIDVGRKHYARVPENADTSDDQCISALLRGLKSVEYIETASVDLPALLHLGKLASLKTLKVHCLPAGSLSSLFDQDLFRHLLCVELDVALTRTESALDFIRSWTRPPLVSFLARLPANPTAVSVQDMSSALSEHCSPTSLETITLSRDVAAQMEFGEILPSATLKSLTCFVNLVELSIDSTFGFNLDDAGMLELARAWPYIEVLHLQALWHDQTPLVTIASLRVLAEHCHSLHSLELTFDASSIPPSPKQLHLRTRPLMQHALTALNVGHSPITNASDAARYLSATFPNLTGIAADKEDWDDGEEHEEDREQDRREVEWSRMWMKVKAYLPVMNDVRTEEFEWGCRAIEMSEEASFEFS